MAKYFETVFEIAGKVAGSFDKSILDAGKNLQRLQKQISALSPVDGNIAKFRDLKTQLNATETEYKQLTGQIAEMARQLRASGPPTKKMVQEFELAKLRAAQLKQTIGSQSQELQRLRTSLNQAGVSTRNLHADQQRLQRQTQQLIATQQKLKATHDAIAANSAARDNFRSQVGDAIAMGASVAIPVKLAADREFNLAQIGNLTDMTKEQLAKLQKDVEKTANATYNSYDGMLQSLNVLLAEGMDIKPAIELQNAIGRAATAANADITDIAKTANSMAGAMKVPAAEMELAFNKLVAAGKAGSFELKDMAQYFPQLTAQASSLGLKGTDGVVTLAASLQMARKGAADASTAAGNFNNFMSKLTSPETKKRFKEMGVDIEAAFKDSINAGKDPVIEMIKLINEMTNGDKFRIGELFGDMQVIDFLNPVLQDMGEYEKLLREIGAANGDLQKDFERMSATSTKQWVLLTNNLGNLASALGTVLLPAVNAIVGPLSTMAGWIGNLATEYPTLTTAIVGTAAGLAALKVASVGLGYVWTLINGGYLTMKAMVLTIRSLTAVQWLWNAALAANPIGLVITAIAALVAAGVMLYQNWDQIKAGAAALWEDTKAVFNNMLSWLSNFNLFDVGAKIISTLIDGFISMHKAMIDSVVNLFTKIREYLPFSDAKKGPLSELTASGRAIVTTLGDGVNQAQNDLNKPISGALNKDLSVTGLGNQAAGASFTYAPTIQVAGANADQVRQNVSTALQQDRVNLERQFQQMMNNESRLSFA